MVKETEYYEALGISVDATENDVKRAYRRLALRYHPDKNPDDASAAEMFKKISHAYEILSDEEKRRRYDQYGASGVEEGGGDAGFDASDIFSMFFGGGGGRRQRKEPKPKEIVHELKISLEEMYTGKLKHVSVVRDRLCGTCEGNGIRPGARPHVCSRCNGRGVQAVDREIFPGMVQRTETTCYACNGEGSSVRPNDLCGVCRGKRTVKDKKVFEVHIEKGAAENDTICFEGEGDEIPGMRLKGDVFLVLSQRPHDTYRRAGIHLLTNQVITLQEALCGFELPLEQLDNRTLCVKIPQGQVIDPEAVWVVHNEGMPVPKTGGMSRGNLIIKFNVEYPKQLTEMELQNIAAAFNVPRESTTRLSGQRVTLSDMTKRKHKGQRSKKGKARQRGEQQRMFNGDEEMNEAFFGQRGDPVQCMHQ